MIEADIDTDAIILRLRDLDEALMARKLNKHERANMLISSCIDEGVDSGSRIVGLLRELGFDRQHVGMLLKGGIQRHPEWPNWGRTDAGAYFVPPEPPS